MATADIVILAAEAREFAGLLRRVEARTIRSTAAFAREATIRGQRVWLLANGPGPGLVNQALESLVCNRVISTGFCGALDPSLRVGDIVEDGIWSEDRVVVTAADKRALRERTGARVVEMEWAAVREVAAARRIPCRAIKVVSDIAEEDLPLNLNLYRNAAGRFQLPRIAMAGLLHPFRVLPRLMDLDRNSRVAADRLGEFLVNCQF